jgi:hypothetical protein
VASHTAVAPGCQQHGGLPGRQAWRVVGLACAAPGSGVPLAAPAARPPHPGGTSRAGPPPLACCPPAQPTRAASRRRGPAGHPPLPATRPARRPCAPQARGTLDSATLLHDVGQTRPLPAAPANRRQLLHLKSAQAGAEPLALASRAAAPRRVSASTHPAKASTSGPEAAPRTPSTRQPNSSHCRRAARMAAARRSAATSSRQPSRQTSAPLEGAREAPSLAPTAGWPRRRSCSRVWRAARSSRYLRRSARRSQRHGRAAQQQPDPPNPLIRRT